MTIALDALEKLARAEASSDWYVEEESDDQGRTVVHMPAGEARYIAATDRKVVLELVQRVRAAEAQADQGAEAARQHFRDEAKLAVYEAIVRDLAAKEPISDSDGDPDFCALCGVVVYAHHESCPWRRAVEATK
jgi:hypothetical protein